MNDAAHRDFKNRLYGQFARLGKALASPHRLELLDLLAQSERTVDALAAESACHSPMRPSICRRFTEPAWWKAASRESLCTTDWLTQVCRISAPPSEPWLNVSTGVRSVGSRSLW